MRTLFVLILLAISIVGIVSADTTLLYIESTNQDGRITETTDTNCSLIRNGNGDTVSLTTSAGIYAPFLGSTTVYDTCADMNRGALIFNTSFLEGKTITSASLHLNISYKYTDLGSPSLGLTLFSPDSNATIVAGDFDSFSDDRIATDIPYASIPATGYLSIPITTTSAIDKYGFTRIMVRDSWDIDNDYTGYSWVSGSSKKTTVFWYETSTPGTVADPYLEIVWTAGGGDTTPPSSLTGMANTTNCSQTNITWTNPPDADFNHTYSMWQNVFDGNLSNTTTHRLKTPLAENTLYTFSTRACDLSGNCNTTWVNHSVTTGACGVAPVAAFSANNLTVCQGTPTTFTDASTNGPLTWNWSFGDGNLSTLQNPVHVYDVIGLKTINLTANNTYGSDYERKVDYINVTACLAPPTPTPTPTPTLAGCLYTNITTVIDENNTEWQAKAGNYTWGTAIINRTQGNISFYSCYATPTPTPTPIWHPKINPAADSFIFFDWLRDFLNEWWLAIAGLIAAIWILTRR